MQFNRTRASVVQNPLLTTVLIRQTNVHRKNYYLYFYSTFLNYIFYIKVEHLQGRLLQINQEEQYGQNFEVPNY